MKYDEKRGRFVFQVYSAGNQHGSEIGDNIQEKNIQ
jgi:hypothetical protein